MKTWSFTFNEGVTVVRFCPPVDPCGQSSVPVEAMGSHHRPTAFRSSNRVTKTRK